MLLNRQTSYKLCVLISLSSYSVTEQWGVTGKVRLLLCCKAIALVHSSCVCALQYHEYNASEIKLDFSPDDGTWSLQQSFPAGSGCCPGSHRLCPEQLGPRAPSPNTSSSCKGKVNADLGALSKWHTCWLLKCMLGFELLYFSYLNVFLILSMHQCWH